jgi:protein TonB
MNRHAAVRGLPPAGSMSPPGRPKGEFLRPEAEGRPVAVLLAVLLHLAVLALVVAGPGPRASQRAAPAALQLVHARVLAGTPTPVQRAAPAAPRPRPERAVREPLRLAAAVPAAASLPDPAATPPAPAAAEPAPPPPAAEPQGPAAPIEAPAAASEALRPVPGPATAAGLADAPAPQAAEAVAAHPDHAHCPPADYPLLLRDSGAQGTVWLRVRVQPDGQAGDVQLLKGSGWRLFDEAASRSVRACRFVPAQRGGERLSSWVEFPVRFALNDPNPR